MTLREFRCAPPFSYVRPRLELFLLSGLTRWFPVSIQRSSSARLPRRILAADCSVTRVSSRFRYYSAVRPLTQHCLAISLALIGWLTLAAGQRLRQSLLRSHVVLPYRAVRNHLGAVGE
jgi:hypothetical protein